MADWSDPTAFQLDALHEALLFAYPNAGDLGNLLILKLGQSFEQLAPLNANYKTGMRVLLEQARAEGWLTSLVAKARQDRPRSPRLLTLDRALAFTAVEVPGSIPRALQDIVRHDGLFQNLYEFVKKLEDLGRRTCRIEHPVNTARGTGWLIGPDLVLTNWHVIERALAGGDWQAKDFVCRFDYATTTVGTQPGLEVPLAESWCVDSSPASASELGTGSATPTGDTLDYALLRLAKRVGDEPSSSGEHRGWVQVRSGQPLPKANDIVFVIQHPDGLPVKVTPGDVDGTAADGLRIAHTANTMGGSSGSVVADAKLDAIALHHAGDALYQRGTIGAPEKNQAIPIGKIASLLAAKGHWH